MKQFLPVVLGLVLAASACTSQAGPDEHVYWVNSLKVPCVGVAPTHCLLVYKGEILDPAEWKILQKKQDKRLVLNDIWVLEKLKGKTINRGSDNDQLKRPQLEIHVGEMKYTGTDGCNNIFGGIIELNEKTLRFGMGAGTRTMCQDMEVPDEFNRTLPEVSSYEVKDLKLHLLDADGNELMQFQKID